MPVHTATACRGFGGPARIVIMPEPGSTLARAMLKALRDPQAGRTFRVRVEVLD